MNNHHQPSCYHRVPKHTESVETIIIQQVQRCPWNPFKFNELITLEKCLREVQNEDPRLTIIFNKLADSSVFVEPSRKKKHLTRKEDDKRIDSEFMKQVKMKRSEICNLNKEIDGYNSTIERLVKQEQEIEEQVCRLKKSSTLLEKTYENSQNEFEISLEKVINSFERSLVTIKMDIPEFIQSINESKLVKQTYQLPKMYKKLLLKLIKKDEYSQQQQSATLSYCIKKNMVEQLVNYSNSLEKLSSDLTQIQDLYSTEIPGEFEVLEELDTHVEFLQKPLRELPKRMMVIHQDVSPLNRIDYKSLIDCPANTDEDPELNSLMVKLSTEVRSLLSVGKE